MRDLSSAAKAVPGRVGPLLRMDEPGKGSGAGHVRFDGLTPLAINGERFSDFRELRAVASNDAPAFAADGNDAVALMCDEKGFRYAGVEIDGVYSGDIADGEKMPFDGFEVIKRGFDGLAVGVGDAGDGGVFTVDLGFNSRGVGSAEVERDAYGFHGESRFGDGVAAPLLFSLNYKHL